jgi:predicted esterase
MELQMLKNAFALILLNLFAVVSVTANTRFVDSVFSEIEKETVTYRSAQYYSGDSVVDLKMDIYQPKNDEMDNRPVVVVLYGGSFISGNKDDAAFSVPVSEYLAKKGYVSVAIDYRVGLNMASMDPAEITKAAYRGIQDTKAAVRFIRANADVYKISTDEIFLCGYSAGAIIALNQALITEEKFRNIIDDTAGLGPLETGDNLSFSSSVKGVAGFAGAVIDTTWITVEAAIPMICIHGNEDGTVPYDSGYVFSTPGLPYVFGSAVINGVLKRIGLSSKLITYPGEDHEFVYELSGARENSLDSVALFFSSLFTSGVEKQNFVDRTRRQTGVRQALISSNIYDLTGRKTGNSKRVSRSVYILQNRFKNKTDCEKILFTR